MVRLAARTGATVAATAVLFSSLLLGVHASETPSAELLAVEEFKVRLIGIEARYERESWKNTADFYRNGPVNGFTNGSARFDTALGYHVILRVGLTDLQGKPVTGGPDIQNVELTAKIDTSQGPREAWVIRAPGPAGVVPVVGTSTSNSPEYFLHFDMDGSNAAPPGARSPLAFDAGSKIVHVTIQRRGATQVVERVGSTDLLFAYDSPRQSVTISNMTAPYTSRIPDSILRGFTDVGKDQKLLFVHDHVPTSSNVVASYEFGKPNATVRWVAFATHQGCDTPSGPGAPNCGPTTFYRRVLRTASTDANGNVNFTATARELLQFDTRQFSGAVVVLAAAIDPADPNAPTLGPEYAAGSPTLLTGAIEFALPITDRTARVSKYSIDTRLSEEAANRSAPDSAKVGALKANTLEIQFFDDAGGIGQGSNYVGDAYAIVDGKDTALASGRIGSHSDPYGFPNYRVARLPVNGIIDAQTSHYTVLGFMYGQTSEFYALARGDRGYVASYFLPRTNVGEPGRASINITSLNTNYDGQANEAGLSLKVLVRVAVPELPTHNKLLTFNVPEGATVTQPFPVTSSRIGDIRILFNGTTGDTLREWRESMSFVTPPPKKSFADRIPGFDGVFAALALALVGVVAWRRGRIGEGF